MHARKFKALCAAGSLGWCAAVNAQIYVQLDVPLIGQQTNSWCWAASGEMVMQWFAVSVQQCTQATAQFEQNTGVDCCAQPTPGGCIRGGQVEIGLYGFTYQQLGDSSWLSEGQVEAQLYAQNEPWILNPHGNGFGHVTVGTGFYNLAPGAFLIGVNDPWPANPSFNGMGQATGPTQGQFYLESYAEYAAGYWEGNAHTEGYDLYNINPPPPRFFLPAIRRQLPPIAPAVAAHFGGGDPDPFQAAQNALEVALAIVTPDNASRLGFAFPDLPGEARLGRPIDQFNIELAALQRWNAKQNEAELLQRTPAKLVEVQVHGRTLASIRLHQVDGRWRMATFGSPLLSRAWQAAQVSPDQFLVEIESLELAFAGRRSGNKLLLTPLFSDAHLGLKAGREVDAREILPRLSEAASAYRPSVLGRRPN